jgi:NTE family protein
MDGGMRTVANADLAHGYERVVIVAPVAAGIGFMASPHRQAPGGAAGDLTPCG